MIKRTDEDKHLILTVGLPYAGKTTWARQTGLPMVVPDAIRMAYGCTFHDYLERQVWATAFTMVRALFLAGHSTVILVATNTTRKRRKEWHALDWTLRYKVIPTPVEECIRRATDDNNPDLIQVIERMNAQWEELDQYELLDLWEG